MCPTVENPVLVYQAAGNPQGTSHPRPGERDSRQAIQAWPDHSNRVVTSFRSIPSYMLPVAPASSGPVCHQVQQQTTSICVTGTRSPGLGSGCTQPFLGRSGPICLSTSSHLGQSGGKVTGLPLQLVNPDCTGGAQHTLVLESGDNVQSDSTVSAQHSPLGVSAIQPGPSQEPGKSEPTCLAPRASAIKEQWFSEAVAARIEAPQRGSTRSVYEAKWAIFTQWCLSNQVDFRAPPLKVIADFLLHLFQDKKLQLGTIDGYRSAIADKLGNSTINVSKDENLTRLLDSFHRDRPKGRRFSCWLWVLVSTGVGSMLGYIGTSDTSQTGLRSPCTLHPAFCPRISWRRRDQIVWPQWPYQLWPLLWISHSRMTGHYVQLEPCATTWTGPQILGRIRSWSLSPSRKGLIKTSLLPLSPHGSNRL